MMTTGQRVILLCMVANVMSSKCGPNNSCECSKMSDNSYLLICYGNTASVSEACGYVGSTNITHLMMFRGNFTSVGVSDFSGCENLLSLHVQYGCLSVIKDNAFKHLLALRELKLSHNNLSSIYNRSVRERFNHLYNLEILHVDGNIKKDLERGSFPDVTALSKLTTLHMDSMANMKFDLTFRKLTNLRTVSLSGNAGFCNLTRIQNDTFEHLVAVVNLTISSCNLTELDAGSLVPLTHLERLDMSHNQQLGLAALPNVSYGLQFTQIKSLNYSRMFPTFSMNTILKKRHLCYLWNTTLEEFDLSGLRIQVIERNALILVPMTMKHGYVQYNSFTLDLYLLQGRCLHNIHSIDSSYLFSTHKLSLFNEEPRSTVEDTYGNECPFMTDEYLLNISYKKPGCNFYKAGTKLSPLTAFAMPENLTKYVYRKSLLEYDIPPINIHQQSIEEIDFSGNLLKHWIGPLYNFPNLRNLDLSNNVCSNVSRAFFQNLPNLEHLQIQNNYLGLYSLNADKEGLFENLVSLKTLNMSSNQIRSLPKKMFTPLISLKALDLSLNVLQNSLDIELDTLENLSFLNLSYNTISTIPGSLISQLSMVSKQTGVPFVLDLTDNVMLASCKTLHFLTLLYENRNNCANFQNYVFRDENNKPFGSDSLELKLKSLQHSCTSYTLLIVLCCLCLTLFICIIIARLISKHRWKLRFLLHMAKRRFFKPDAALIINGEENEDNVAAGFDAFISYSEEDVNFIRNGIIPQLEDNGLRLCIHQRDFLAGKAIADNIVDAIEASRKTIAIVTENYVQKRWCLYEFQMARMRDIYNHNTSLLIVLLKPVSIALMPLEMVEWMDQESYLEYTDNVDGNALFWERLRAFINA